MPAPPAALKTVSQRWPLSISQRTLSHNFTAADKINARFLTRGVRFVLFAKGQGVQNQIARRENDLSHFCLRSELLQKLFARKINKSDTRKVIKCCRYTELLGGVIVMGSG